MIAWLVCRSYNNPRLFVQSIQHLKVPFTLLVQSVRDVWNPSCIAQWWRLLNCVLLLINESVCTYYSGVQGCWRLWVQGIIYRHK